MRELTDHTIAAETARKGVMCLYLWGEQCPTCARVKPIVLWLASHYKGVRFFGINAEENDGAVSLYHIQSLPTVLFFVDGKLMERQTGSNALKAEDVIKRLSQ